MSASPAVQIDWLSMSSTPRGGAGCPSGEWSQQRLARQNMYLRELGSFALQNAVKKKRDLLLSNVQEWDQGPSQIAVGVSVVVPRWSGVPASGPDFGEVPAKVPAEHVQRASGKAPPMDPVPAKVPAKRDQRASWKAPPMDPAEFVSAVRAVHAKRDSDGAAAGPALLLTSALAPRPEARREGGSKRRRVRPVTVPLQLSGEAEGEQLSGSWPLRLFAIAIAILPARLTIAAIVLRLCSCGVVIFCCFGESSSRELRLLVAIIIAAIATAIAVPLR